jgi:NAD(P)-dependent dehydrogenase (short-subunit alcohol dehydrogenase family)
VAERSSRVFSPRLPSPRARINGPFCAASSSSLRRKYHAPPERYWRAGTAIGRTGTRSDIAKGIVFLVLDDAAFRTGAGLVIDGGIHSARNDLVAAAAGYLNGR